MVRGSALLGPLCHYHELHGREGRAELIASLDWRARQVFSKRIRTTGLYAYAPFTALLRAIDLRCGNGDLSYCEVLGRDAAMADMRSGFSELSRVSPPGRLLRNCGRVWERHYEQGTMRAVSWGPEGTVVRIEGFAGIDQAHCRLMKGWLRGALEALGVRVDADPTEACCAARGDDHCEFRCTWTEISPAKRSTVELESVRETMGAEPQDADGQDADARDA